MKALITRKLGMASVIGEDGVLVPITLLSAKANTVTQIKTTDSDGYNSVQLGAEHGKKLGKALLGHLKKSKVEPKLIREFRIIGDNTSDLNVGSQLEADIFAVGDVVNVSSISKGKGWAGTIKRHNFKRGRKTHGGRSYRRPGSIGSMYPQKVIKGKRMAGQMGGERVTIKNLKVALVSKEDSVIGVTGAVPGPKKAVVLVRGA